MIKLFKKLYNYIVDMRKYDPITNCKTYKDDGCNHVDGIFCEPRTCSDFIMIRDYK